MRNPNTREIAEQAERELKKRRGAPRAKLFMGDDRVQQELHKKPITDYSTEHYVCEKKTLPFRIEDINIGIPRFYAVMYSVFVSLEKIYAEGTVTRWASYLGGFLPSEMFPSNKRRKLQEVLADTWFISRNYIERGAPTSRFTPAYSDSLKKYRSQFVAMKTHFE